MSLDLKTAKLCVGPGWHPLLELLYAAKPEDTAVVQVKEKFGGLRFYVDSATEGYFELIDEVEVVSFSVCEWCGKLGELRMRGWMKTLCDGCQEKREKERN